jgi:hypothetical protein
MGILGKAGSGASFTRENNPSATDMAPMVDMVEARRRRKSLLFVITREEVTAVKWYDATTH